MHPSIYLSIFLSIDINSFTKISEKLQGNKTYFNKLDQYYRIEMLNFKDKY
jgi:hypothetical protein